MRNSFSFTQKAKTLAFCPGSAPTQNVSLMETLPGTETLTWTRASPVLPAGWTRVGKGLPSPTFTHSTEALLTVAVPFPLERYKQPLLRLRTIPQLPTKTACLPGKDGWSRFI